MDWAGGTSVVGGMLKGFRRCECLLRSSFSGVLVMGTSGTIGIDGLAMGRGTIFYCLQLNGTNTCFVDLLGAGAGAGAGAVVTGAVTGAVTGGREVGLENETILLFLERGVIVCG